MTTRGRLSPGYAHQLWVPLRGGTFWGCNLRGVNLRWVILRAPAALDHAVVAATVQQWRYHLATCVNASSLHLKHAL